MQIKCITINRMQIPLRTPFATALRRVDTIDDCVVKVECSNGAVGYGEAPPTAVITGDTTGSIINAIEHIARILIGKDVADLNMLIQLISHSMCRNTSAKAAMEMAIYDLWSQSLNLPLHHALGSTIAEIKTDITISVNEAEQMVADALDAVERGFDHLKIKVGRDPATDAVRLRAIQDAVGSRANLSIDANQGWTAKDAIRIMRALENADLNFDYLEQPVKAGDLSGLRQVTRAIATPVLADEAVFSLRDAVKLLENGAADLVNIKLMKTGGIAEAMKICDLAQSYHVECMIGAMLEGPVSITAAACFAASRSGNISRFDLDGPVLAKENPVIGSAVFNGPLIKLPTTPGLGITGIEKLEFIKEIR